MTMNANQQWIKLIRDLINNGTPVVRRGLSAFEILSYTSKINMKQPLITIRERNVNYKFLFHEAYYILTGKNNMEILESMKGFYKYSDDGNLFRGAYGPRIINQLSHIVLSLLEDPFTRQAVLTIWEPNPAKSKDIPCTISMHFQLRQDKTNEYFLDCFVTMRSSDAFIGWIYDVFNFSMISLYVLLLLKRSILNVESNSFKSMDKIENLHLNLGNLYLTANNQHIYSENIDFVTRFLLDSKEEDNLRKINLVNIPAEIAMLSYDDLDIFLTETVNKYKTESKNYLQEEVPYSKINHAPDALLYLLESYKDKPKQYFTDLISDTVQEIYSE